MSTFTTAKAIAARSTGTFVQDVLGAAALVLILIVGLYLPSFF